MLMLALPLSHTHTHTHTRYSNRNCVGSCETRDHLSLCETLKNWKTWKWYSKAICLPRVSAGRHRTWYTCRKVFTLRYARPFVGSDGTFFAVLFIFLHPKTILCTSRTQTVRVQSVERLAFQVHTYNSEVHVRNDRTARARVHWPPIGEWTVCEVAPTWTKPVP